MSLTKEEEQEIKILFSFPLEMYANKTRIVTRGSMHNKKTFLTFLRGHKDMTDDVKETVLNLFNGKPSKLRLKNIKVNYDSNNTLRINGVNLFQIISLDVFQREFDIDFIKAQRMHRIYKEYVLEKMKEMFNDKT